MNRTLARLAPAALVIAAFGVPTGAAASPAATGRPLTLEERVQAQRAIEEVYWQHRTWPKENPTPKPPLPAVLSDAAIRVKVEDYLRKSNALETWWQRPVTAEQLQAEMDRMAKDTRDPEMLRELYAVLGNDAFLIAETLARPTLVDRLIRSRYAGDEGFQGEIERRAREAAARARSAGEMPSLGGEYATSVYRLAEEADWRGGERLVRLEREEWNNWRAQFAAWFGEAEVGSIPLNRPSVLQEDADRYFVVALLARAPHEMTVATVAWAKRRFDAWWRAESVQLGVDVQPDENAFALEVPAATGCVEDTWQYRVFTPGSRVGHTAVWTGAEMIIWGGWAFGADLNTGARYDPATASWTPTSTGANVPSARVASSAVWTGTEMIVWGGLDLITGGRYNPATDSWMSTSTGPGVPYPRIGATAVWTGTEMVVWGGFIGMVPIYDKGGYRYNPETDSWTYASIPGLTGRVGHTAIWTGTEMIVWGGYGCEYTPPDPDLCRPVSLDTGGRYDPETDSWELTSTGASLPSARSWHTALWTGAEMIVWGGSSDPFQVPDPRLNTGGRYDPATDSWSPTSTGANVPSRRGGHTAVWTGAEMIVWGGADWDAQFSTGGRYDPTTDSWTSTSTGANTPPARSDHTAVWTGTEMIVSGGSVAGDLAGDLGLYCAPGCQVPTAMWRDLDGDGFGDPSARADSWTCTFPSGWTNNDDDCDDANAGRHPGTVEIPGNPIDEDCTGSATCDSSAPWGNHGDFVGCVARACNSLVEDGSMDLPECAALVSEAAGSCVGRR